MRLSKPMQKFIKDNLHDIEQDSKITRKRFDHLTAFC